MTQIVQRALDLIRPHRSHRLYPMCFVSEVTKSNVQKIYEYLIQDGELSANDLEEIKHLLDENPKSDGRNIYEVVTWDGFTLLQHAVLRNHLGAVKLLLKKGCDVNAGICSLPLHLACKMGHVHVVQLLLTYGARAASESTVCYPEEHKLKTHPDQMFCLTYQSAYTPIIHALIGDHEQVMQLLLHHENSRNLVKTDYLLHEACKMGAHQCCRYILQRYSEQISVENTDGKTPLQISLLMDTDNTLFLMDHGAEFKDTVFLTDEGTTLHEMYRFKNTLGLAKMTKFALEYGFRSHINVRDQEGNTALHVLLKHIGRTVRVNIQSDYDKELVDCIKLLLVNGADPNLPNHIGETPLHAVLCDHSARQLYVSRHGQVRRLKPILQEICKVVQILISHGANVKRRPGPAIHTNFVSPLYYAIRIFQSLQPDMFVLVKTALKQLIILLCHDGCKVNACDSYGLTPFLIILTSSFKWMESTNANQLINCTTLAFVSEIMQHFLKRGLDPCATLTYWTRRMEETIETTYYKQLILFLNLNLHDDPQCYVQVRSLLVKLIQRGGDPNCLTFTPSYGTRYSLTAEVPVDASLSYLMTRSLYVHPDEDLIRILDVFDVFCHTLKTQKLAEFIGSIRHFVGTDFKSSALPERAEQYVQTVGVEPRCLKSLCRLAITENLEWRLHKRVHKLPLPKILIHYVLNFES